MNRCEQIEMNISSMLDGELFGDELLETVDHLIKCDSCKSFYNDARSLQNLIRPVPSLGENSTDFPDELWSKIEKKSRKPKSKVFKFRNESLQAWGVAATILLVFGLWFGMSDKPFDFTPKETITINLAENTGKMTESRFIELTAELLKSDKRYHRKMLDVMNAIQQAEQELESGREIHRPETNMDEENIAGNRSTVTESRTNASNPVNISFW